MRERRWYAALQSFTANGAVSGKIAVLDSSGFHVKQEAILSSLTQPNLKVQIKRVEEGYVEVGKVGEGIDSRIDITKYLVADGAAIQVHDQSIPQIPPPEILNAAYIREPAAAIRTRIADEFGRPVTSGAQGGKRALDVEINANGSIVGSTNPLPVQVVNPITPTSYTFKSIFNSVSSIPIASSTLIGTYTVPVGKTAKLEKIDLSGSNIAEFTLKINGVIQSKKRTEFTDLNSTIDFSSSAGYILNAGDIIEVFSIHNRPFLGDFESRIQIIEIG